MKLLFSLLVMSIVSCTKIYDLLKPPPPKHIDTLVLIPIPPQVIDSLNGSNILCVGNSLTFGYLLADPYTQSYPAQLHDSLLNDSVTVENSGVPGQTTEQMITDFSTQVTPYFKTGKRNIMLAWEIGNDIFYNGWDGKAYDRFVAYCDSATSKGWEVYAMTLPYRNSYYGGWANTPSGIDTTMFMKDIDSVNADLRRGFNKLVDLAKIFPAYDQRYYYSDHVHFNEQGYTLIVDEILKTLRK